MDEYGLSILANMGMLSFLALSSYVLLIGGSMSFGQQAFFAIGAYAAGIATVLWALPLSLALVLAAVAGAGAAGMLAVFMLRLRGVRFAVASLAAAEAIRIGLELFSLRAATPEGRMIGPNGAEGFGGIRYLYERGYSQTDFVLLIYGLLILVLLGLCAVERTRAGLALRMAGEDPELAGVLGIDARTVRLAASAASGAVAALGGGLFAHYNTYVEPRNFEVMLGIHGLFYTLVGGIASPLGPLLGVFIDVLLMEGSRIFHGYRMIVFGGFVTVFLILRPRGILDERVVQRLRAWIRRDADRPHRSTSNAEGVT